eukprot:UN23643
MSAIHAVIYSEYVSGAGIIAGSPYGCQILPHAQNFTCSYDRPNMDLEALWKYTTQRATDGFINPLETMRRTKFYFYSGTKDIVVSQTEMNQTMQFYKHYTDDSNVKSDFGIPSQHGIAVDTECCDPCGRFTIHYDGIQNCKYDTSRC